MTPRDELIECAERFLTKLAEVEQATSGIYTLAAVHGCDYDGPNYAEEKQALITALAALRSTPGEGARPQNGLLTVSEDGKLIEAASSWTGHDADCDYIAPFIDAEARRCTCGLHEFLQALRVRLAAPPPASPAEPLITECCGADGSMRYCPKCGWEARLQPPASPAEAEGRARERRLSDGLLDFGARTRTSKAEVLAEARKTPLAERLRWHALMCEESRIDELREYECGCGKDECCNLCRVSVEREAAMREAASQSLPPLQAGGHWE